MYTSENARMSGFLFEQSGFTAQLCNTKESLEIAYELRYRAYRSVDGIPENESGLAIDDYDGQSNCRTHLLYFEGKPVASVRSLIWSDRYQWQRTPCLDAFEDNISEHLGLQQRILESNRFVVDPDFKGRKSLTAQYLLFRVQTISCLYDNCQYVITAVRPKHASFYKRLMDFDPISEPGPIGAFPDGYQFECTLLATPYSSRHVLAENASMAALQLEDFERYASYFAEPQLA